MALDFHAIDDEMRLKPLFQLNYSDYERLQPAFNLVEKNIGLFIDPYGTTHLTTEHLGVLKDSLSGHHQALEAFLQICISENREIVIEGD